MLAVARSKALNAVFGSCLYAFMYVRGLLVDVYALIRTRVVCRKMNLQGRTANGAAVNVDVS
jgi:hypothetical protein